jgi:hypothetical protein
MARERPLWAQGLTFPARVDRQLVKGIWPTEGVLTGLSVVQHGAGAFSVDINIGTCVIAGDDQANQGSYLGQIINGIETVTVGAAPGSNSRIDLIVARVYDPDAGSGASPIFALECIAGTAAPSPVPPATPNTAIVLAWVTVLSSTVSILTANITDKRTGASGSSTLPSRIGGRWRQTGATQGNGGGGDITVTWDVEDSDSDGFGAAGGNTLTIPAGRDGVYSITGQETTAGVAGNHGIVILLNGAKISYESIPRSSQATSTRTIMLQLAAGNTIGFVTFQSSGSTVNYTGIFELWRVMV